MTASSAYLPFKPVSQPPRKRLPQGSCDCHFHVFDPDRVRYPLAQPRSYTPTPAPLADYRAMAHMLGIERAVLVHPSVYGRDHATFEHTLAACGDWMRGVAVVYPDTTDAQLERWHALGARGTRCNALFAGGAALDALPDTAARVRALGWHLQLMIDVSADPRAAARAADLGLPVVLDHFGHVDAQQALADRGFADLLALLREGRVWVKLSGAYRITSQRRGFEDVRPLVDALWHANPKQLVWGSDWPHPGVEAPMPDDVDLAEVLFDWFDPVARQQLLVDNPTRLYWS